MNEIYSHSNEDKLSTPIAQQSADDTRTTIHPHTKGADLLLAELHDSKSLIENSAYVNIRRLLTLGGRIPYEQALESLTPFEKKVVGYIQLQPKMQLVAVENLSVLPDNSCLVVQEGHVGHVSILTPREIDNYKLAEPHFIAGALQFPPEQFTDLEAYKDDVDQRFLEQAQDTDSLLRDMEKDGVLQMVISNIRDNLMRVAPTFIHVGHHMYSTFDRVGKNLVDRNLEGGSRLLTVLAQQPVNSWHPEDQVYVYGVYLLLTSGGPSRIEEFNGGQLSSDLLHKFFDDKAVFYSQYLEEEVPQGWTKQSLLKKAQWVGQKLQEVNSRFQRYRVINGLMIHKEEKILDQSSHSSNEVGKRGLENKILATFGIEKLKEESDEQYWQRVTQNVIQQDLAPHNISAGKEKAADGVSPLPFLLWSIVETAAEATNSDYSMSSTFRNIHKLLMMGPLSLEKKDLFCCVVPSQRVVDLQENKQITETLQLIASRMEFNRWHFIPGNIKREEIPSKRDWLYPPAIPDITAESDWHHGGHISAKVHHSLRYPSSMIVGGKEYRGSYDIRLMRQSGEPYKPDDIRIAKEYLDILGIVYGAIARHVETTHQPLEIDAFTTLWYRDGKWMKYKDATV